MKMARVRALVLVAATVFAGTALGAAPASAEEVPEEWGDPVFQAAFMTVVGRQDGYLPGRRGNQHVVVAITRDEEVLTGQVNDWRCPAGVTAPVWNGEATTCLNKGSFNLDYDYDAAVDPAITWAHDLRYMTLRTPARLLNGTDATTVRRGTLSLRVRATGALEMDVWDEFGDTSSFLSRQDAYVVGGKFLGTRWLDMTSVEVLDNYIAVYGYYDVPVT